VARLHKEAARNAQKADKTAIGEKLLKFPIFSFIRVYGMDNHFDPFYSWDSIRDCHLMEEIRRRFSGTYLSQRRRMPARLVRTLAVETQKLSRGCDRNGWEYGTAL
jgi:hypothetical protein